MWETNKLWFHFYRKKKSKFPTFSFDGIDGKPFLWEIFATKVFLHCFMLFETFNAFDKDGSAQLGYAEYKDAWKFLNRPGDDSVIKQ